MCFLTATRNAKKKLSQFAPDFHGSISVVLWRLFFLLRLSFFLSALSCKGRKCMEQDQKHSKACIQAGMRSLQECWHGKESNYPSMNVKKKVEQEGERGRGSEKTMRHTHAHVRAHTFRRAKPPHSSAALHRGKSVSPARTRHIKEPSQEFSIATPFSGIDAAG